MSDDVEVDNLQLSFEENDNPSRKLAMDEVAYYNGEETECERLLSENDFTCTCCYDLMVQPTTLNCGHNFCRVCLASWFLQSKKQECPQCRQAWQGHPKVNVTLRSTIAKLFGERAHKRTQEVNQNEQSSLILGKFDRKLKMLGSGSKMHYWNRMSKRILLVFASSIVTALLTSWFMSHPVSEQLLVQKPVVKWSVQDVSLWVTGLGEWAADIYAHVFEEKRIDGLLLMAMEERDLIINLGMENSLHRRALMLALNQVRERGVKPPTNLWEYKSVHRGTALLYLVLFENNPRLCVVYMYVFDYHDSFLPFIHGTTPFSSNASMYNSLYSSKLSHPSKAQMVEFFSKWLVFPFYLVAQFSLSWLDIHYWTSRLVIAQCFVLTMLEANTIRKFLSVYRNRGINVHNTFRYVVDSVTSDMKSLLFIPVIALFWNFIPSIVCDCLFYGILFLNPLLSFDYLWREICQV